MEIENRSIPTDIFFDVLSFADLLTIVAAQFVSQKFYRFIAKNAESLPQRIKNCCFILGYNVEVIFWNHNNRVVLASINLDNGTMNAYVLALHTIAEQLAK